MEQLLTDASFRRIRELRRNPYLINELRKGLGLPEMELDFGVEYLKIAHAYIFQDAVRWLEIG